MRALPSAAFVRNDTENDDLSRPESPPAQTGDTCERAEGLGATMAEAGTTIPAEQAPDVALAALAQGLEPLGEGRFRLSGAAGWMQGRTMYGGASSFIGYAAASATYPDLPPLRAGQVGFIGPVGDEVEARVTMLRTGRSVSHVETTLHDPTGALVHRATWLFGSARPSNGEIPPSRLDAFVPPEESETYPLHSMAPSFIRQFELRRSLPRPAPHPGTLRRWVRLNERAGLDPFGELVGIGDTLPPGSLRATERRGPISSINWSFTLLTDAPATRDGWWLLETASNGMAHGFSSETLRLWNADGVEQMRGLQSVALFG